MAKSLGLRQACLTIWRLTTVTVPRPNPNPRPPPHHLAEEKKKTNRRLGSEAHCWVRRRPAGRIPTASGPERSTQRSPYGAESNKESAVPRSEDVLRW